MKRTALGLGLLLAGCGDTGSVMGSAGDFMTTGSGTDGAGTGGGTTGGAELPEMVEVPGGEGSIFGMCVDDAEPFDRQQILCEDVDRLRWFQIDSFTIDATEVTRAEYEACVQAGACVVPDVADCGCDGNLGLCQPPSYDPADRPDHPVTCVSWQEARDYCHWKGGELPTGLQWEKAARGTQEQLYAWGHDAPTCEHVVARGLDWCGDEKIGLQPVGSRPLDVSQYGTLDMLGNAGEWVYDRFPAARTAPGVDRNHYSTADQVDTVGPGRSAGRTVRGGRAAHGTDTHSLWNTASAGRDQMVGFRCVVNEVESVCGNGTIELPEICDDGNAVEGDGCSSDCERSGRLEVMAPMNAPVSFGTALHIASYGDGALVVGYVGEPQGQEPPEELPPSILRVRADPHGGPLATEVLENLSVPGDAARLLRVDSRNGDGPVFVTGTVDDKILVREVALYDGAAELYPWEVVRDDGDGLADAPTSMAVGYDFEVYVGGVVGRATGISDGIVAAFPSNQSTATWEKIWTGGDDGRDAVLDVIFAQISPSKSRVVATGYMTEGGARRAVVALYDVNGTEMLAPTAVIPADDPPGTAQEGRLLVAGDGLYLVMSLKGASPQSPPERWRVLRLDPAVLETGDVAGAVVWDVPWEPEGTLESWPNTINGVEFDALGGGVILGGSEGPFNGQRPNFTKLSGDDGSVVWTFEPAGMWRSGSPGSDEPLLIQSMAPTTHDELLFLARDSEVAFWGVLKP